MSRQLAELATDLCRAGRMDEAWDIAEGLLRDSPHAPGSVILASYVAWKMRRAPLAYQLALRGTSMAPRESTAWENLGTAAQELWLVDESEVAYKTAFRLAQDEREKAATCVDLAALYIECGRYAEAEEQARKALRLNGESAKAKANLGFALLGQRKWEGWDWYSYTLGLESRRATQYADEPPWDGTPGLAVAFYGEQGLGDELSFASMVPDALKDCGKVIIDCDSKLKNLLQRSFPKAKVYGTRHAKEGDGLKWAKEDWRFDASLALGELGKFYRRTDDSFPGTPYLVADPERRKMWRLFFASKPKLKIGIAWTGGIDRTGAKLRKMTLEQLASLMESVDAHWVSLQYKDAEREIAAFREKHPAVDLVQYPFATLTPDYDDTAALVAELDLVICMQTAVAHLAGALGKDCWVLLPKKGQFRYGYKGDTMPWYKSLRVFRQRSWNDWLGPLGEVQKALNERYPAKVAA